MNSVTNRSIMDKKKMYNTPKIEVEKVGSDIFVMTPPSPGSEYNPAPARHSVAPPVPGDKL